MRKGNRKARNVSARKLRKILDGHTRKARAVASCRPHVDVARIVMADALTGGTWDMA